MPVSFTTYLKRSYFKDWVNAIHKSGSEVTSCSETVADNTNLSTKLKLHS